MKQHHIRIIDDSGAVLLEETRKGGSKAHKSKYIRQAVNDAESMHSNSKEFIIWFAQGNAKSWSLWRHVRGQSNIEHIGSSERGL